MNVVTLKELSVSFGTVKALTEVSVELQRGEVVMLVGPNGAGKTTLARVLLGLVRPQNGSVEVDGTAQPINNTFKKSVGYLPESVAFPENLRGEQVLRFYARARGVPKSRIKSVLERVGLSDAARRAVRGYSRGMRQRLGLGIAILAEPDLLILDEPAGGLDSEGLAVLWSVLDEWRRENRMVLMTSHQLNLLERRVDRVCVFKSGKVIANGTPSSLRDRAGLPQRALLSIGDDDESIAELLKSVREKVGADIVRSEGEIAINVADGKLLSLVELIGKQDHSAIQSMRVEEPTLDMVYEKLLEAN
jgi:Cu-processing system ATP-binding protein